MTQVVSSTDLDNALASSPLAGKGVTFVLAGRQYGVDPRFMVAIARQESSLGKYLSGSFNPFGIGPGVDYPSWDDAIFALAKRLRELYLDVGLLKIHQIGAKYAPVGAANDPNSLNQHWVGGVARAYRELGGDSTRKVGPSKGNWRVMRILRKRFPWVL